MLSTTPNKNSPARAGTTAGKCMRINPIFMEILFPNQILKTDIHKLF